MPTSATAPTTTAAAPVYFAAALARNHALLAGLSVAMVNGPNTRSKYVSSSSEPCTPASPAPRSADRRFPEPGKNKASVERTRVASTLSSSALYRRTNSPYVSATEPRYRREKKAPVRALTYNHKARGGGSGRGEGEVRGGIVGERRCIQHVVIVNHV